jgi:tetratricopeptide (TPR) repeat protein
VHYCEGRLPEAIREAWKLVESSPNTNFQATVALSSTLIYFSTNRDTEAWNHAEIALVRASYVGNRFIIARALELMGYGYLRRGDYENAHGAYDAAADKYPPNTRAETRCKGNMAKSSGNKGTPT